MRLLILGSSGGVGRWLTRLAAVRGHAITSLVRPGADIPQAPDVRVLRGDVLDPTVLEAAVADQDAVASCLGLRRVRRSPWARLLSPADLTARVTATLVPAMQQHGVRRLVVVSAGGVGDSAPQLTPAVRWLVRRGNLAVSYRDLEHMEAVLRDSGLDWLAVRPVTLTNGPPTGRSGPVSRYGLFATVRRADVAAWILGALERPDPFADHTVLLGSCSYTR